MKKKYLLILALLCTLFPACQKSEEDFLLEQALELAGPNRAEIQKVLDHYVGDSLKLEAAKFLIRYMPGHYSYVDTATINKYALAVDSVIASMRDKTNDAIRDSIDSVAHMIGMDSLKIEQDCRIITADYLIQNIDTAFYDWQEGPWAKHVSFEDFCERILPYKVEELQPLDNWRSRLKKFHSQNINYLSCCDQARNSPLAAAMILNRNLSRAIRAAFGAYIRHPKCIPLEHRAKIPFGRCEDYVAMTTIAFRSHGIPVTIHFTPQWAKRSLGHSWNMLLPDDGKEIMFCGITDQIGEQKVLIEVMPKIYRRTYSWNMELVKINKSGEYVPSLFRDIFIRDVTKENMESMDVSIKVIDTKHTYAYLHVFNNHDWVPVAYGITKDGKAHFKNMGPNVVYLPAVYSKEGEMIPIANPFILGYDGKIKTLAADHHKKNDMILDRKYPVKERVYLCIPRLDDGEFQASNDPDFETYYVAHHIKEGKASGQNVHVPDTIPPCRYWRYTSDNGSSFCNIAEIMFFEKGKKEKLEGIVIGTDGSWGNRDDNTKEAAFDGDILTAFDAPQGRGCWAGLDMGEPKKVDHIIYYGRGDGNGIEIGDEYELLYWDKGWKSMGKQKAKNVYVKYKNVPQNALYHLKNHTKGTDERIFTFENGKQVWW